MSDEELDRRIREHLDEADSFGLVSEVVAHAMHILCKDNKAIDDAILAGLFEWIK